MVLPVVTLFLIVCISFSLVAKSCPTLATPCTVACQAPLSLVFSKQEYWSGLPFPSLGSILINLLIFNIYSCPWSSTINGDRKTELFAFPCNGYGHLYIGMYTSPF